MTHSCCAVQEVQLRAKASHMQAMRSVMKLNTEQQAWSKLYSQAGAHMC